MQIKNCSWNFHSIEKCFCDESFFGDFLSVINVVEYWEFLNIDEVFFAKSCTEYWKAENHFVFFFGKSETFLIYFNHSKDQKRS